MAQLPVDARVGKLLLLAALMGCLAPALSIAAALSYKSPFLNDDTATRSKQALAAAGSCPALVPNFAREIYLYNALSL